MSSAPTNPVPEIDLSIIIVSWNVWPLLQANLRAIEAATKPLADNLANDGFGNTGSVNTSSATTGSINASSANADRANKRRVFGPDSPAAQSARPTLEVIIVDNDSSDPSPEMAPTTFPWIRFIQSGANLGFTKGNNLGFTHARGKFIYFLNPDTEVIGHSIWTLYQAISNDPTIGVIGPRLQYGEGDWQNNRHRFPTRWTGFWESTWLGQFWPNNPWARSYYMRDKPDDQRHDVDWLMGSAICLNRKAIEDVMAPDDVGPFDEGFFMYSEELDLCKRIKDAGWRNVYEPEALVIHYEGRSSEQAVARRHINFNTSKVRYYRKYFGPFWAEILRQYLLFEFRWQIGLEAIKKALGHMPELRQQRIGVYRQVLSSKLRSDNISLS